MLNVAVRVRRGKRVFARWLPRRRCQSFRPIMHFCGRHLALALLLAACTPPPHPDLPMELRTCPAAADAPPRLGRLVTVEALRARYYAERAARLETQDALETCAQRLARVLEIVGQ